MPPTSNAAAIRYLPLLLFALLSLAQLFTLQHCATPTPPSGGARDTLGPVLVAEETTPNFQTDFRPDEIVLTFDEWVVLDPQQEILISPPLELGQDNRPTLRRRSLVIPLGGLELRDSVTYVVNVGAAIKDLNEGNPTENMRFVFATGPVLDTASVSGTLVRDYSGEPLENGTFALFSNLVDTAVTTGNPTYFAQTDERGNFTVYNVRPGVYRAIALERNPSATNYFIDVAGFAPPLAIGFLDTLITVADGENTAGTVTVSTVAKPLRINHADTTDFGRIRLVLNQPAQGIDLLSGGRYLRRNEKDTVNLYAATGRPDTFVVARYGIPADTLVYGGTTTAPGRPARLLEGPGRRINPAQGVVFTFDRPLADLDPARVSLLRDTLPDPVPYTWALDSVYPGRLRIDARWEIDTKYKLEILPDALTGPAGGSNPDTLSQEFFVDSPEKYGLLRLRLTGLDSTQNYIVQLVGKDAVVPRSRRIVGGVKGYRAEYAGLAAGAYRAEIILDANDNGRYDAGDFFTGRQPETVRRFELEALRANWEVEEEIDLRNGPFAQKE